MSRGARRSAGDVHGLPESVKLDQILSTLNSVSAYGPKLSGLDRIWPQSLIEITEAMPTWTMLLIIIARICTTN